MEARALGEVIRDRHGGSVHQAAKELGLLVARVAAFQRILMIYTPPTDESPPVLGINRGLDELQERDCIAVAIGHLVLGHSALPAYVYRAGIDPPFPAESECAEARTFADAFLLTGNEAR